MTSDLEILCREDRIDSIADAIFVAAMQEALAMQCGHRSIREAMKRAMAAIDRIEEMRKLGKFGAERMNSLREWLGMMPIPDADGTAREHERAS